MKLFQKHVPVSKLIACLVLIAFGVQVSIVFYNSITRRQFEGVSLNETQYEEILFRNEEQQIDLAGMLFLPVGEGPFPAAVIIHGSGTSMRNNGWYLTLTHYLQSEGIAILLPDKRGSEKSGGDWRTADYHDLTTDTVAAVEYLKTREDIPISNIGIIGMSEGGKFSPLVASRLDNLEFVINVVGSAVLPREQLLFEENYNLQQMGIPPVISYLIALGSTAHIRHVRQPEFWDAVSDFNPNEYWQQIDIDALVLYGEDDTNVPSAESARRLEALNNSNIKIIVYEDSGHALEEPEEMGNSIFRQDALEEITRFILAL